jgi:hypothetical protein
MSRLFIAVCIFFTFIISANAMELYSCIDKDGNKIVTSSPQDGMTNCVLKDSQEDDAPKNIKEKQYYSGKSSEREAKAEDYRRKRQKEDCEKECYDAEQSCFKSCDDDYKNNNSGRNFCRRGCSDTRNSCKKNRCN